MFVIPKEALADGVVIVGKTGSGKTHTAKYLAEPLLAAGERVCVIDPTGVWYGLRSRADGKAPGFPVVVFGGDHADVPIAEGSGAALAEVIASQHLSTIVDVSGFTMGARTRFMTVLFENLYKANRLPLTLIMDEADVLAPQRPMPEQTVLLNRTEQIVRRGRVRGFRPWMITQRPAVLHKDVMSQAGTLIAMKLTAAQDRAAVGAWIEGQADREKGKSVLSTLPQLKRGEGWVWCPEHEILQRVLFPPICTFDSSASPVAGKTKAATMAPVDVSVLLSKFETAVKEAEDNDPKLLRKRIAELEKAARQQPPAVDVTALRAGARRMAMAELEPLVRHAERAVADLQNAVGALRMFKVATVEKIDPAPEPAPVVIRVQMPRRSASPASASIGRGGERRMMNALAQCPEGLTRKGLGVRAGLASKSGTFGTYLSNLRQEGFVGSRGDRFVITDAGLKALGPFEPLPTGDGLLEWWIQNLGTNSGHARILRALSDAGELSREELGRAANLAPGSGTFGTYLSKLRTLELIEGSRELRLSESLR